MSEGLSSLVGRTEMPRPRIEQNRAYSPAIRGRASMASRSGLNCMALRMMKRAASKPAVHHGSGRRRTLLARRASRSSNPTTFHPQPAAHVAFAQSKMRIENQPPFEPSVGDAGHDRRAGSVAVSVRSSLRINQFQAA